MYLGRLGMVAVEDPITEQLGSPVATTGEATAVGERRAKGFTLTFDVHGFNDPGSVAAGQTMRRQLRSLVQNHAYRLGGLYLKISPDPERNGWLVLGEAELQDADGGVTFGSYKLVASQAFLVATRRTHREGFRCDITDLRLSTSDRDYLGQLQSTDFAALPNLPLFYAPPGAADISVLDGRIATSLQRAGRDGACAICAGRSNGDVISWERAESVFNTGDVVAYDRRGYAGAPSDGPDASWEEMYGPDYAYNWLTAGQPADAPVLDNGLVRVRYDATVGKPGLRVDVWQDTVYAEQGKLTFYRVADSQNYDDTWISASLVEYSPDKAVMQLALSASADTSSRERIFITMRRGHFGITVDCYPSAKAAGGAADVLIAWTPTPGDVNDSAFKSDSQTIPSPIGTAAMAATAGSGSALFPGAALGGTGFVSSENYIAYLRCVSAYNVVGPFQHNLVVLQGALAAETANDTSGYGSAANLVAVFATSGLGYTGVRLSFTPTNPDQVMEAEALTLGTGTASTADAAASGGFAATATRTTDANAHVTKAAWATGLRGVYRVIIRAKVSANTGSVYVKTGVTTGTTVTFTSTSYIWIGLGDIIADGSALETHAWIAGGGTISIDRIEAFLVQDRTRAGAQYSGARDRGQAALAQCVPQLRRPARATV